MVRRLLLLAAALTCVGYASSVAWGTPVSLLDASYNPSFETPGVPGAGWSNSVPAPWTISGPGSSFRGLATYANVAMPTSPDVTEGSQVLWLAIAPGNSGTASLSPAVITAEPLTKYTLTVAVGWRQTTLSTRITEGVYTVEILLDGNVVGGNSINFGTSGDIPANEFVNLIAAYNSPGDVDITKLLSVRLTASVATVQEGAATGQALFDNVRLTAEPIPEPSSGALLFVGSALGMLGIRRKRA